MNSLKMKYTLVPAEIEGPLQDVTQSLKRVEAKVDETLPSGPFGDDFFSAA